MLTVNHPARVTEKERSHVCTSDEQRKVPMDKVGIQGDIWSEVMWLYSAGHTETRAIMPLKRCVR